MSRRIVVVAALATSLVAGLPTAAHGAVKPGVFRGTTSEADAIGFKVDRKGRVHSLYYEAVTLSCTDGDNFDSPAGAKRVQTPAAQRFQVRTNKFGITARNETTGFGWDLEGGFKGKGRRATGTLKVFAVFNENNQQDVDGSVRCESRPLTWTARRRAR
jgi:hypothetical protein